MKDGWVGVTLADRHFKVKEANLYNRKIYEVERAKTVMTSEQRDKINRKIKRQSKRIEAELANLCKEAANKARLAMLEDYKDEICFAVEHGVFGKNMLDILVQKVMKPFIHGSVGFKTVVNGKQSTSVNILTLSAVGTVLSDKQRADELSWEAAKQQQKKGKQKRTPNTTRGEDGVVVREKLQQFNNEKEIKDNEKKTRRAEEGHQTSNRDTHRLDKA